MNKISLEQQICLLKADNSVKEKAMVKLKEIKAKSEDTGSKARQYLDGLLKIPFSIYKKEPILYLMDTIRSKFKDLYNKYNIEQSYKQIINKDRYTNLEILKYIKPGSTMLELGSHWSYYSMWFQKEVPGARNYMIEPDPINIEVGKRNFILNNMIGEFYNASIGRNSSPPAPFECESDNKVREIPRFSVDDFVESKNINYVDLLFADIQGYEYQMLEGATKCISNGKIRFIFLSTHHHLISNDPIIHHRCLDFLKKNKAHIIVSHTVTESYSGDGLIVASFLETDRNIPEISISRNYPTNSLFREIEFDFEEARIEIERLSLQIKLTEQSIASHLDKNEGGLRAWIANKLKIVFGYLQ
jgi:FkbM family methyltransferase